MPDLLQTDDYARAIAAAEPGYTTAEQREDAVAAKAVRRQVVLSGMSAGAADSSAATDRRMWVILGEGALRQAVGGPGVLAGQISHLIQLGDGFPGLTIQVLPFAAGSSRRRRQRIPRDPEVPDAPSLGVVYLEALSGGVYLESQPDVARYIRAFALLRAAALSPADSLRLLRSLGG